MAVLSVPAAFLVSPLGLVLAILARRDIKRSGRKGSNWATVGIVLSAADIAFTVLVLHRVPLPFF